MSIKNRVKSLFRREEVKGPLVTELEERLLKYDCPMHVSTFDYKKFSSITGDEATVVIKFLDRLEGWGNSDMKILVDHCNKKIKNFGEYSSYKDDIYCYQDRNGVTRVRAPKIITPFYRDSDTSINIPRRVVTSISVGREYYLDCFGDTKSIGDSIDGIMLETIGRICDDQELIELFELDITEIEVLTQYFANVLCTIPWHRDLDLMASRLEILTRVVIHTMNEGIRHELFCLPEVVEEVVDKLNEVCGLYGDG